MFSHVKKCGIPSQSGLLGRVAANDYTDCYSVVAEATPRQASLTFTEFPEWTRFLLRIRYMLTAPFGLLNDVQGVGDKVGPFPVESETGTELIAGFNDKHLDFRVSVLSIAGSVYLATWVHPHNVAGKAYLTTILPFHRLIVRNGLARVGSKFS